MYYPWIFVPSALGHTLKTGESLYEVWLPPLGWRTRWTDWAEEVGSWGVSLTSMTVGGLH